MNKSNLAETQKLILSDRDINQHAAAYHLLPADVRGRVTFEDYLIVRGAGRYEEPAKPKFTFYSMRG